MAEITPKQQEVLDWLSAHPWSTTEQIAEGLDTTLRGAGNRVSKLMWASRLRVRHNPTDRFEWQYAASHSPNDVEEKHTA